MRYINIKLIYLEKGTILSGRAAKTETSALAVGSLFMCRHAFLFFYKQEMRQAEQLIL